MAMTPQDHADQADLRDDVFGLVRKWEELGIDPDDFLRCARCHRFFPGMLDEVDANEELCTCKLCFCGEPIGEDVAEMYDPQRPGPAVICHPGCGLRCGLEVA
jgi:hypothetical protein